MGKSNLRVENIVATTSLGKEVPLTKLARTQSNTEYNPEQFPGLVLRIEKPKSAVLVFSSGNLVCSTSETGNRGCDKADCKNRRQGDRQAQDNCGEHSGFWKH